MSPAAELAYLFHSLATEARFRVHINGICTTVSYHATPEARLMFVKYREEAYRQWPKWSGCGTYPILNREGAGPASRQYYKACCEQAIWFGEYGELRKALALHLHEYFKALDEQPQPEFNV